MTGMNETEENSAFLVSGFGFLFWVSGFRFQVQHKKYTMCDHYFCPDLYIYIYILILCTNIS